VLAGWQQNVLVDTLGGIVLRLTSPAGATPIAAGTLLRLKFDGYVGETTTSELPFSISLSDQRCLNIVTSPGEIMLDSI
jgi:hypothetical protein